MEGWCGAEVDSTDRLRHHPMYPQQVGPVSHPVPNPGLQQQQQQSPYVTEPPPLKPPGGVATMKGFSDPVYLDVTVTEFPLNGPVGTKEQPAPATDAAMEHLAAQHIGCPGIRYLNTSNVNPPTTHRCLEQVRKRTVDMCASCKMQQRVKVCPRLKCNMFIPSNSKKCPSCGDLLRSKKKSSPLSTFRKIEDLIAQTRLAENDDACYFVCAYAPNGGPGNTPFTYSFCHPRLHQFFHSTPREERDKRYRSVKMAVNPDIPDGPRQQLRTILEAVTYGQISLIDKGDGVTVETSGPNVMHTHSHHHMHSGFDLTGGMGEGPQPKPLSPLGLGQVVHPVLSNVSMPAAQPDLDMSRRKHMYDHDDVEIRKRMREMQQNAQMQNAQMQNAQMQNAQMQQNTQMQNRHLGQHQLNPQLQSDPQLQNSHVRLLTRMHDDRLHDARLQPPSHVPTSNYSLQS